MSTHQRQPKASLAASAVAASMFFVGTPPASAPGPDKLVLIALYCEDKEDVSDHDEAYLTVDDVEVWSADIAEKAPASRIGRVVRFDQNAVVRLYDEDTGVWDKDDFLGSVNVSRDQAAEGTKTVTLKGDGAQYRLTYRVVRG